MKAVADTGPLLAAANNRDEAHALSVAAVHGLGRNLIVLDSVLTEVDHLLRNRMGDHAGRAFLTALTRGEYTAAFLTPGLLRDAAAIDTRFADLGLGLVDASIMAYAARHDLPILTYDFEHFRAAPPQHGYWRLIVDEARYSDAVG